MKQILGGCGALVLVMAVLAVPILDFLLVLRIVYVVTVPDLLSPFGAIFVGCLLAALVFAVCIAGQGNTVLELLIPSLILFVLLLVLYPVAAQIPEKRRYNQQKRALKRSRQGLP